MQKREEEAAARKQAAALRRKEKEDEAKAALQRRQLEQQQRKADEAKSLAVRQQEEQARQRVVEEERERQRELQREKLALACMHHSFALLRWTGWEGWRRYVLARRQRAEGMAERGEQARVRRLWRLWRSRVEQRKAEEAREEERKLLRATRHHQRRRQASAFHPWHQLTAQHSQLALQSAEHYQRGVQRAAYLLWVCRVRAAVAAHEERLRVLELRAVGLGQRHLLRFWLLKWKHAHALTREEKQMSAIDRNTRSRSTAPTSGCVSPPWSCCALCVRVCSGELKEETWKKVNGWLSSYRAQRKAVDSI